MPTLTKPDTAKLIKEAEAMTEARRRQGWTQNDFAAELARALSALTGGPAAIFIESRETVSIGTHRFAFTEAAYIRAHSGCALSAGSLSQSVGIDDETGSRWLLESPSRGAITLTRHETKYELRPEQVMRAFTSL